MSGKLKSFLKILGIALPTIAVILVFVDVHLMRGNNFIYLLYREPFSEFKGSMGYSVTRNDDGTFDLYFKNNDFAYYPVTLYRNDDVFYDLNDTVFFAYAARFKISGQDSVLFDTGGGWDCGTGLGEAFIRPFETFELKGISLEKLVSKYTLRYVADSIRKHGVEPDSLQRLKWQFYLPVFSLGAEDTRVYSNKFLVGSALVDVKNEDDEAMVNE
jgi:hypothetical protein